LYLTYDETLSCFAFNLNLRRYSVAAVDVATRRGVGVNEIKTMCVRIRPPPHQGEEERQGEGEGKGEEEEPRVGEVVIEGESMFPVHRWTFGQGLTLVHFSAHREHFRGIRCLISWSFGDKNGSG
jgi:hypothetical protein